MCVHCLCCGCIHVCLIRVSKGKHRLIIVREAVNCSVVIPFNRDTVTALKMMRLYDHLCKICFSKALLLLSMYGYSFDVKIKL